ncbi:hypothetical protein T265_07801 [Opisthorchis viverrini]|uniref:Uncharacterized protein n=1 Tax=Opisthorchis viverrini TaxID=6198 RepID=A0A074ZBQ2_OPIVI|nr:hypothetical protein T265_07801 [Opisthorchis viverrini]KER24573.1 hypothetical protein T265_07801 [Opisthorchis viverrini]
MCATQNEQSLMVSAVQVDPDIIMIPSAELKLRYYLEPKSTYFTKFSSHCSHCVVSRRQLSGEKANLLTGRLGEPGNIPALVLPSDGMAAGDRKSAIA